jgi:hypothetical protein
LTLKILALQQRRLFSNKIRKREVHFRVRELVSGHLSYKITSFLSDPNNKARKGKD